MTWALGRGEAAPSLKSPGELEHNCGFSLMFLASFVFPDSTLRHERHVRRQSRPFQVVAAPEDLHSSPGRKIVQQTNKRRSIANPGSLCFRSSITPVQSFNNNHLKLPHNGITQILRRDSPKTLRGRGL